VGPTEIDELLQHIRTRRAEFDALIGRGDYTWLLTLLELPYTQAVKELPGAFHRAGLDEYYGDDLLRRIAGFALNLEGSGSWAELAVQWLESGLDVDDGLRGDINLMIHNKRATQRARQKAYRAARRHLDGRPY
jgi:hypothetical protein